MPTVREMARLLAGLPEVWQDTPLSGMHGFPPQGVTFYSNMYGRGPEVAICVAASAFCSVTMDGEVNPADDGLVFGGPGWVAGTVPAPQPLTVQEWALVKHRRRRLLINTIEIHGGTAK